MVDVTHASLSLTHPSVSKARAGGGKGGGRGSSSSSLPWGSGLRAGRGRERGRGDRERRGGERKGEGETEGEEEDQGGGAGGRGGAWLLLLPFERVMVVPAAMSTSPSQPASSLWCNGACRLAHLTGLLLPSPSLSLRRLVGDCRTKVIGPPHSPAPAAPPMGGGGGGTPPSSSLAAVALLVLVGGPAPSRSLTRISADWSRSYRTPHRDHQHHHIISHP